MLVTDQCIELVADLPLGPCRQVDFAGQRDQEWRTKERQLPPDAKHARFSWGIAAAGAGPAAAFRSRRLGTMTGTFLVRGQKSCVEKPVQRGQKGVWPETEFPHFFLKTFMQVAGCRKAHQLQIGVDVPRGFRSEIAPIVDNHFLDRPAGAETFDLRTRRVLHVFDPCLVWPGPLKHQHGVENPVDNEVHQLAPCIHPGVPGHGVTRACAGRPAATRRSAPPRPANHRRFSRCRRGRPCRPAACRGSARAGGAPLCRSS